MVSWHKLIDGQNFHCLTGPKSDNNVCDPRFDSDGQVLFNQPTIAMPSQDEFQDMVESDRMWQGGGNQEKMFQTTMSCNKLIKFEIEQSPEITGDKCLNNN